jgi:hypothetical protein
MISALFLTKQTTLLNRRIFLPLNPVNERGCKLMLFFRFIFHSVKNLSYIKVVMCQKLAQLFKESTKTVP